MNWLWIILGILFALAIFPPLVMHLYIVRYYIPVVVRIFQEKPLFIMPFGQPVPDAEHVVLMTPDGLSLHGCYLHAGQPRKGVLLFGLEFGSNRWACLPYCEFLRAAGYDIFTFEMRGQGESPAQTGYEPLQWVTDFEVIDFQTAIAYLKSRSDRDPRGVGFFGLSKGGSAGLMVAAQDSFIRCCAVDGVFASLTTMVPYMRRFVQIYSRVPWLAKHIPYWYLRIAGKIGIRRIEKLRDCHYPPLEGCMPKLAPRPLLMIHGGADSYITPEIAKALFALAEHPKELWLVEKAKHNQSIHLAGEEYKKRVQQFFDMNLAALSDPAANGAPHLGAAQTKPASR